MTLADVSGLPLTSHVDVLLEALLALALSIPLVTLGSALAVALVPNPLGLEILASFLSAFKCLVQLKPETYRFLFPRP